MTNPDDAVPDEEARVGLCFSCARSARIVSARGSRFYLCEWSKVDPAFPRYPRLPVLACPAWRPFSDRSQPS